MDFKSLSERSRLFSSSSDCVKRDNTFDSHGHIEYIPVIFDRNDVKLSISAVTVCFFCSLVVCMACPKPLTILMATTKHIPQDIVTLMVTEG